MANNRKTSNGNVIARVVRFYVEGFRSMTVGRTLWAIIIIKLVIMFAILKLLLFPDFLSSKSHSDQGKAQYVREQLQHRQGGD